MRGREGKMRREKEDQEGALGTLFSLFLDGNGDNTRFFFFEGSVGPNV